MLAPEGLEAQNDVPFKGNFDIPRLKQTIKELGAKNIAFIRIEAGSNLIGGLKWEDVMYFVSSLVACSLLVIGKRSWQLNIVMISENRYSILT